MSTWRPSTGSLCILAFHGVDIAGPTAHPALNLLKGGQRDRRELIDSVPVTESGDTRATVKYLV